MIIQPLATSMSWVTARVINRLALPDGTLKLLVTGSKRAAVVRLIEGGSDVGRVAGRPPRRR
jgi:hypothetical protein